MKSEDQQPAGRIVLNTLNSLRAYFDPLRQRIVQSVAHEAHSPQEIADIVGVPFTRLYYHLRMLEQHNILRVVETRTQPGAIEEKRYRVTARMFVVDRSLLKADSEGAPNPGLDIILRSVLDETHTDIEEAARAGTIDLQQEAPHPAALLIRRGVVTLGSEQGSDFMRELLELVGRYQAMPPEGEPHYYGISFALYPTPLQPEPETGEDDVMQGTNGDQAGV